MIKTREITIIKALLKRARVQKKDYKHFRALEDSLMLLPSSATVEISNTKEKKRSKIHLERHGLFFRKKKSRKLV